MRILALSPGMHYSGAPLMLFNLLASLVDECSITIVSLVQDEGPLAATCRAMGMEVCGPDIGGRRFDVCLCNTILASHAVVQLSAMVPAVWWIHEPAFGLNYVYGRSVNMAAFETARRVVFPTLWQAQTLYGPWLRPGGWEVVPSGILPPDVDPPPAPDDEPRRRFTLAQVGSLCERKGPDLTVKAVDLLDDDDVRVLFIGESAKNYQLEIPERRRGDFAFLGEQDKAGVVAHLKRADAFILPTRDDLIPLVVLEAMHYRKPVLTSDFGPIPETVIHGRTGLLSPVGDHHVLAGNIAMLKRDPALGARLAADAHALYRRKHGFEQHRASMLRILRDVAGGG
jgi:alpha-maltose-1-phosphate synthase